MSEHAVLFVDDESHVLTSLKRALRKEPYRIHTAPGGRAGLEVLAEHPVQLVVSDQRMPEMSGTRFLEQVKALYPDTIRIVLSGYAEAAAIVEAINQGGVYRFIGKPWQDDELRLTIRQCLEHFDIVAENERLQEQSALHLQQLEQLNRMLEGSVEVRTRSLQLSQEILESLPLAVMGISQEEEIVLTNGTARTRIQPLTGMIPGTLIEDILPEAAVRAIRSCLTESLVEEFEFDWGESRYLARPSKLGGRESPRGCVLLLKGPAE